MRTNSEYRNIAINILEGSDNNFLDYNSVKNNLLQRNVIVLERNNFDYNSYMLYSKDKTINVININSNLNEKQKYENLLQQYCMYYLSDTCGYGYVSVCNGYGHQGIKRNAKLLYREISEESADRMFGAITYKNKEKVK